MKKVNLIKVLLWSRGFSENTYYINEWLNVKNKAFVKILIVALNYFTLCCALNKKNPF